MSDDNNLLSQAVDAWSGVIGAKQDTIKTMPAMTGDGKGNVDLGDGWMYVRLSDDSPAIAVLRGRFMPVDGVRVNIIKKPGMTRWMIDDQNDERLEAQNINYGAAGPHGWMHRHLATDAAPIDFRQIEDLRVYHDSTLAAFTVGIRAGWLPRVSGWTEISAQTLPLDSYIPPDGALWVKISLDSSGVIAATPGVNVPGGILDIDETSIPATPSGHFAQAAVRLYTGQAAIREDNAMNDMRDCRWPQEQAALPTPPSTGSGGGGLNPMITLGDMIVEGAASGLNEAYAYDHQSDPLPTPRATVTASTTGSMIYSPPEYVLQTFKDFDQWSNVGWGSIIQTQPGNPIWILIDLGADIEIAGWRLKHMTTDPNTGTNGFAVAGEYTVESCPDGSTTYTLQATQTVAAMDETGSFGSPVTARYWRFTKTAEWAAGHPPDVPSTDWEWSINDIRLYSTNGLTAVRLPAEDVGDFMKLKDDGSGNPIPSWQKFGLNAVASILTLASGAVTVTADRHAIAAETGTTDDLTTISGTVAGQIVVIQADAGDTITVKHGAVNVFLNGEADFVLSGDKKLALLSDGTNLVDMGAGGGGGSDLTISDEGTPLTTAATSVDFTGGGVTASAVGDAVTVDIPDILTDPAWTAKGQIVAATGSGTAAVVDAPTANGQYPVADSGETTGIKWTDPATAPALMITVPGALTAGASEVGAFVAPGPGAWRNVYIRCKTPGSAGATTVDVHDKNGATIFTTQGNRPALAYDDADGIAVSGTPDVTAIAAGDLFTFYIDGVATDAADLIIVPAIDWIGAAVNISVAPGVIIERPSPVTPTLYDDEFDGMTLDEKWSEANSGCTVSINDLWPSWVNIKCSSVGAAYTLKEAFTPAGDFSITLKGSNNFQADWSQLGISVLSADENDQIQIHIQASTFINMHVCNGGSWAYTQKSTQIGYSESGTWWVHLERRGNYWYGYASRDGRSWILAGLSAYTKSFTVAKLSIEVYSDQQAYPKESGFDYVRINDFFVGP